MKHPGRKALIFVSASIAFGIWAADRINDWLGIELRDKNIPQVALLQLTPQAAPNEPLGVFETISMPADSLGDDLYLEAVRDLASALELRTGRSPAIVSDAEPRTPARSVALGRGSSPDDPQAYILRYFSDGDGDRLELAGGSRLSEIHGVFFLAEDIRAGMSEKELRRLDRRVAPRLRHRYVDLGGVGIEPDESQWGNDYSHHQQAFQDLVSSALETDEDALEKALQQLRIYLKRVISYGCNGIVVQGLLEFVNFDRLGDGLQVYPRDSPYRRRHQALRYAFGRLWALASEMGLKVVFKSDMLALTPPLEDYLRRTYGDLDAADPQLWEAYRLAAEELMEAFPQAEGLMIRVGEAGSIYNLQGWDYFSRLEVTTLPAVRTMLEQLSQALAARGKTLFFRSWSVGVGSAGDMHTSPETYREVVQGLEEADLVISTKYVMGDFDSFLPLNPTLFETRGRRLIEFQARREFEGFGVFPNFMGPLHQAALRELTDSNPSIEGVWLWTQSGGPPRAGPLMLYPFRGFWHGVDLNVYATLRLSWNPQADVVELARRWVNQHFSRDPRSADDLVSLFLLSRQAVRLGLYIGPFARRQVVAMGLEPPPMLWIFKWDIVSGASGALSPVYWASRDAWEEAIAEGAASVRTVERMLDLALGIDPSKVRDPRLLAQLVRSLEYQKSLFEALSAYREAFLSHYRWLDTGESAARHRWQRSQEEYRRLKSEHESAYGDDLDFPAYSFFAADRGLALAHRGPHMAWTARALLAGMVALLAAGVPWLHRRRPLSGFGQDVRLLWSAFCKPWTLGTFKDRSRSGWLTLGLVPWALALAVQTTFSSFLSPLHALWLVCCAGVFLALWLTLTRPLPAWAAWAAVGAPLLLKAIVTCAFLSIRGPDAFWYRFWTAPDYRMAYLATAAASSLWMGFTVAAASRASGLKGRQGVGSLITGVGAALVFTAVAAQAVGLEAALTAFNDEMAILPMGLSRILGISTHLNIPADFPFRLFWIGGASCLGGLALRFTWLSRLRARFAA